MNRKKILTETKNKKFDLIVIGAGATGAGIALDATTRGLSVLLIEKDDFSCGTSSKSTKMLHGGVRYLENAILNFDKKSFTLVKEGLEERGYALKNMKHLANSKKFITPLYRWIDIPKVFIGLKLYDIIAGKFRIGKSSFLSRANVKKNYTHIKSKNLKGAVTYYDGQFNDVRANISIILTAFKKGALVLNYSQLIELNKSNNKIIGVKIKDKISNEIYDIESKAVINATGPFVDTIRFLDNNLSKPLLALSSGVHIVVNKSFLELENGVFIPSTEDGRVLFILPWEDSTLIGTTDNRCELEEELEVKDEDIEYILRHINRYFNLNIEKKDIQSSWLGLRPLVFDNKNTASHKFLRSHYIDISDSGLITIAGGKWTSYRKMAEDTVDVAIERFNLDATSCITKNLPIIGSDNFDNNLYKKLMKKYDLDKDVAIHFQNYYGSYANKVARFCIEIALTKRLDENYPYLEGEVIYIYHNEMAISVDDILSRRLLLKMIDSKTAQKLEKKVQQLIKSFNKP